MGPVSTAESILYSYTPTLLFVRRRRQNNKNYTVSNERQRLKRIKTAINYIIHEGHKTLNSILPLKTKKKRRKKIINMCTHAYYFLLLRVSILQRIIIIYITRYDSRLIERAQKIRHNCRHRLRCRNVYIIESRGTSGLLQMECKNNLL